MIWQNLVGACPLIDTFVSIAIDERRRQGHEPLLKVILAPWSPR